MKDDKPCKPPFMMNFRVENLVELLEVLKEEGITVVGELEEYDDSKLELWGSNDKAFL